MPRRNYYRQRLLPQRSRNNIISHFVRTRETDVKGIIAKTTQLFGQRHFRYTKDGCWLFLPTQCQQQRQPVLSNAIRDRNPKRVKVTVNVGLDGIGSTSCRERGCQEE